MDLQQATTVQSPELGLLTEFRSSLGAHRQALRGQALQGHAQKLTSCFLPLLDLKVQPVSLGWGQRRLS